MKTKHIIYPAIILLTLVIPIARYYASTPEVNACVQEYVDNLEDSNNQGYIYKIDGRRHIEPANSSMNEGLKQYLVGRSEGCLMFSGELLNDLNNSVYCAITYIIKNAPISDEAKKPLALYKTP